MESRVLPGVWQFLEAENRPPASVQATMLVIAWSYRAPAAFTLGRAAYMLSHPGKSETLWQKVV